MPVGLDLGCRSQIVRVGVLTTWALAALSVFYVALTWQEPNRSLILVVVLAAIVEGVAVLAVPRARLTASGVHERFQIGWNCAHAAVAIALCHLDGGLASPFVVIFFLLVAFAGGALSRRLVLIMAACSVVAVLAILALHRDHGPGDAAGVVIAGALVVLAGVCATFAGHRERHMAALRDAQEEIPHRLARVVEYRDNDTGGHIERMSEYSQLIGRGMGLAPDECRRLKLASTMHDIGKVAVPDAILLKPGRLTAEERAVMETHAQVGHAMLEGSGTDLLDLAATIALTHHERFDGAGYPHGVAGRDIPLAGRIVAVADVFDAVTSKRVYKDATDIGTAVEIIRDGAGTQFDPDVVAAFVAVLDEIVAVKVCSDATVAVAAPEPLAA